MALAVGDRVGVEVWRPTDDGRFARFLEDGTVVAIGEPFGIRVKFDNGGIMEADCVVDEQGPDVLG